MTERIFDYTTLSMFQECRRKYYFWGVKHLQPKTKSNALLFGTIIHDVLDIWYLEKDLDKAVAYIKENFHNKEGDDLRTVENATKLITEYARVYKDEPFTIVGKPEAGFVMPIDDILFGGRLDLMIDWDGELWILEHKTCSRLDGNFFKQFDVDKQVTGYIIGAEFAFGKKVKGAWINALEPWKQLVRPTSRSKKIEDHYQRSPVTKNRAMKERFLLNVKRIVRDIKWCEGNDEFYEAEKKEVCRSYNYDCPYKELCIWGEDARTIEREFRVEKWEPYVQKEEETKGEVCPSTK